MEYNNQQLQDTLSVSSSIDNEMAGNRATAGAAGREKGAKSTNHLICRVCGDKALGYNFDAIACESCKAFFRRNALKKKNHLLLCPSRNSCAITVSTRRYCQKCRLRKCLQVGMKAENIMSEEQKQEKRRRLQARAADADQCSATTSQQDQLNAEQQVEGVNPASVAFACGGSRQRDEENVSGEWCSSWLEEEACSRTTTTTTSESNQQQDSSTVVTNDEDTPTTQSEQAAQNGLEKYIQISICVPSSQISPLLISASSSSSCPEITSIDDQDTDIWIRVPRSQLLDALMNQNNNNQQTATFFSSDAIRTASSSSNRSPLAATTTAATPHMGNFGNTCSAASEQDLVVRSSADDDHDYYYYYYYNSIQLAGLEQFQQQEQHEDRPPPAAPVVVESRRSSSELVEAILPESPNCDYWLDEILPMPPSSPNSLALDLKMAKLEELPISKQICSNIHAVPTTRFGIKINPDDLYKMISYQTRCVIAQFSQLSAFRQLPITDKQALIINNSCHVGVLHAIRAYDKRLDGFVTKYPGQSFLSLRGDIYEEKKEILSSFLDKWRFDDSLMLILTGIAMFSHYGDMTELSNKRAVEDIRQVYLQLLQDYLDNKYGSEEGRWAYEYLSQRMEILTSYALRRAPRVLIGFRANTLDILSFDILYNTTA